MREERGKRGFGRVERHRREEAREKGMKKGIIKKKNSAQGIWGKVNI